MKLATRARLCKPVPPPPAWQPSPLTTQWFLVQKKNPRGVCPPPPAPTVPNLLHYSATGFLTARCLVEWLVLLGLAREGGTMLPEPG